MSRKFEDIDIDILVIGIISRIVGAPLFLIHYLNVSLGAHLDKVLNFLIFVLLNIFIMTKKKLLNIFMESAWYLF